MGEAIRVALYCTLAGAAIPLGGALALVERIRPRWLEREFRHFVIAVGGGVLLSAVALVLVPEGIEGESIVLVVAAMLAGGLSFMGLDVLLSRSKTSASQLAATLADFLPEAAALGAAYASGGSSGRLLALLIFMQNLPEGFNACREIASSGTWSGRKVVLGFAALVPLGPAAGLCGLYLLGDHPTVNHAVMLFASGGILYLTFQDIAPQAKLARAWAPPLGAVFGFLLGVVGHMLLS